VIRSCTFAGTATTVDGERVYIVSLLISADEMDAVIAAYAPQSPTSPPAADCRAIAKPVVDVIYNAITEQP